MVLSIRDRDPRWTIFFTFTDNDTGRGAFHRIYTLRQVENLKDRVATEIDIDQVTTNDRKRKDSHADVENNPRHISKIYMYFLNDEVIERPHTFEKLKCIKLGIEGKLETNPELFRNSCITDKTHTLRVCVYSMKASNIVQRYNCSVTMVGNLGVHSGKYCSAQFILIIDTITTCKNLDLDFRIND